MSMAAKLSAPPLLSCPAGEDLERAAFNMVVLSLYSRQEKDEVKIYWLPCSACGQIWDDTWEPASKSSNVAVLPGRCFFFFVLQSINFLFVFLQFDHFTKFSV